MEYICIWLLLILKAIPLVSSITIEPIGNWEIIWNWKSSHCVNSTPDQPARAFKLSNGYIEFIDGDNMGVYQMRGPNLNNLTQNCTQPIIDFGNSEPYAIPSEYNNSQWIESVWREPTNSNIVHAIVHNEFHGEKQINNSWCPSNATKSEKCVYMNALCAVSNDGGNKFELYNDINQRTCIVTPFEFISESGTQGYAQISNILYTPINDSYHYLWINVRTPIIGVCLWRNNNLSNPNGWRAWNTSSNSFDIISVDPYLQSNNSNFNPNKHLCHISKSLPEYFARSWTFNNVINMYLHVAINSNNGYVQYSYSKNIFDWSKPQNIIATNFTGSHKVIYPVLFDETSTGVNFEYTNQYPWLYLVRWDNASAHPPSRDIIRIKLKVSP